jgi:hypothetical protein
MRDRKGQGALLEAPPEGRFVADKQSDKPKPVSSRVIRVPEPVAEAIDFLAEQYGLSLAEFMSQHLLAHLKSMIPEAKRVYAKRSAQRASKILGDKERN